MKFKLRQPLGYSHIGRKDQQEDAVWPLFNDVNTDQRCFVLCDGVGGSDHGEVASQNSSRIIGEYLTEKIKSGALISDDDVQDAVAKAYDKLEEIDKNGFGHRSSMATTLTCVCLNEQGITAAHIGDSRIYLVRPRKGIIYQSEDHSLLNALLKAGELSVEEAENFPRKNVITKAIQPHSQRVKAEIHHLTDVKSGDYLFLCSDGVLENVSNDRLVEVLSSSSTDEEKLVVLEMDGKDKNRDNYTAYLIPIDNVDGRSSTNDEKGNAQKKEIGKLQMPKIMTFYMLPGDINAILRMNCSNAEKLQMLEQESLDKTFDNYTAYLIPIDNVE